MSKFKIGDRVRFVEPYARLEAGAEGTVTGFWGGGVDVNVNGVDHGCFYSRVELIPAITIEPGRHYRTRSGKVTGRVSKGDAGFEAVVDGRVRIFDKAGGHVYGDADLDIVEAWVPRVGERVRRFKGHNPGSLVGHEAVVRKLEDISHCDSEGPWLLFEDETSGYATSFEPLPVAAEAQPAAPSLTGSPVAPTPVAAQVDTLAEEYGPARVATTSDDDDIVEMSIGELTMAIAEALRVVGKKTAKKPVKIGDAVTLSAPARIAGIDKKNAMVVLDTGGSFALPLAALRAA